MGERCKILLAALMALAVLTILVSPAVPSPATVLRARQHSQAIFFVLMITGCAVAGRLQPVFRCALLAHDRSQHLRRTDLLDLISARLI